MNYIVISPFYPENFQKFSIELAKKGITVLAIGQEPYEQLGPDLQEVLTEYFRVENLEDIEEVKRAVAFLFYKHGPIDRIESHNEYWLEQDAALREQFHVFGAKPRDLKKTKLKSEMKKFFKKAAVPVVPGKVVKSIAAVDKAVATLGLPLIAKPDNGVGAAGTFKLKDKASVEVFKAAWDESAPYFLESFVDQAEVCTYDGIVDKYGQVVYETSMTYCETPFNLSQDHHLDIAYYAEKEIDPVLRDYGQAIVKQFGMKERFFHIEFFRKQDGSYVALEYNNRPAGGFTVDVYNHGHRIDLFERYAALVAGQEIQAPEFSQYSLLVSRRKVNTYVHSEEEIYQVYGDKLIAQRQMTGAFADLLGDVNYFFGFEDRADIQNISDFVKDRKK